MTYLEAKKLKEDNLHIINSKHNGGNIDELIIHPTDPYEFEKFTELYLDSFNAEESILDFKELDLTVSIVLEKEKTWENGLFFIENLVGLKNENIKLNL
tara:strand:- start:165 stop:461 length:297 start_codon:yes stop_codon:yes gene_type:complete